MKAGRILEAVAMYLVRARARRGGIDLDSATAIAVGARRAAVRVVEDEREELRPAA